MPEQVARRADGVSAPSVGQPLQALERALDRRSMDLEPLGELGEARLRRFAPGLGDQPDDVRLRAAAGRPRRATAIASSCRPAALTARWRLADSALSTRLSSPRKARDTWRASISSSVPVAPMPSQNVPTASPLFEVTTPRPRRIRRGTGVVTWKSSDAVGTFLRRIGAAGAAGVEARQVSRALRGELNRVLNAESANLQRAVSAAGRQLDAIAVLDADGRLPDPAYVVRLVADARRETPRRAWATSPSGSSCHRSAVQRALERLERLADARRRARRSTAPSRGRRR